ncbi:hypothetical protein [Caenimonas soli]|uniref:hypothetical protein n=1 Tax=Caenimonas soli TaxID=2735555 RepID=UPI001554F79C|nr:hypothetical protein [Caenimonas soli]NPC55451.1 hypothetical protein [Caenimonas soli]
MVLHSLPNYSQSRSYVLQLHRDAVAGQGRLFGRIEHMASGASLEFASGQALLDWLALHLAHASSPAAASGDSSS